MISVCVEIGSGCATLLAFCRGRVYFFVVRACRVGLWLCGPIHPSVFASLHLSMVTEAGCVSTCNVVPDLVAMVHSNHSMPTGAVSPSHTVFNVRRRA